jgi:hypothetical protein
MAPPAVGEKKGSPQALWEIRQLPSNYCVLEVVTVVAMVTALEVLTVKMSVVKTWCDRVELIHLRSAIYDSHPQPALAVLAAVLTNFRPNSQVRCNAMRCDAMRCDAGFVQISLCWTGEVHDSEKEEDGFSGQGPITIQAFRRLNVVFVASTCLSA